MNPSPPTPQAEFVDLCIRAEALRFGKFTLKSGRVSPYFFNAGRFHNGALLAQLARHYARLIVEKVTARPFMLYGPAYKGIPLAAATAVILAEQHGLEINYAFNRKQPKDHGEGGNLVGAPLTGRVVIIDDVITAGTSITESIATIITAGATPDSAVIALDRQETITNARHSATQAIHQRHAIPVHAIITLDDLIHHPTDPKTAAAITAYRTQYGVG